MRNTVEHGLEGHGQAGQGCLSLLIPILALMTLILIMLEPMQYFQDETQSLQRPARLCAKTGLQAAHEEMLCKVNPCTVSVTKISEHFSAEPALT